MKLINDGNKMPTMAYGTWRIENGNPTTEAVIQALEQGYRHIDTAAAYGNDFAVGKAIKKCGISRDELFITNKLWNSYRGYEESITACKRTLKMMKLEYLDAYLIHWPASSTSYDNWEELNLETWRGLEQLKKDGLVKSIGVSNFLPHHLKCIIEQGTIRPVINQFEMHPGKKQSELVSFCKENGIEPMAWSPLGHGAVLEHPIILTLSEKYGMTPAQICLRYILDKDMSLVTRSVRAERMQENLEVNNFKLEESDIQKIDMIEGLGDTGLHPDDEQLEEKLAQF